MRAVGVGVAAVLAMGMAGCKTNSSQAPIVNGTDSGSDPAAVNMAPVNGQTQVMGESSSYAPEQQGESYPQGAANQGQDQYNYNGPAPDQAEIAGEEAMDQADMESNQAPPPLPEYDQPPPPNPNYIWTPGYWAWGSNGYYWVPGAWVAPPYYGALWTPPYWGYYNNSYYFHTGYWGPHVGFYGGIDYGYGYIGLGYFGGYWRGHNFYYNRDVNNVGRAGNVYSYPVVYNNRHYNGRSVDRTSYNGGRDGVNVRPRPAEMAARAEAHTRALPEQTQVRQQAAGNREQFYGQNHGRPAQGAVARPVAANRPIAEAPRAVQQEQHRDMQMQQRNVTEQRMQEQQHGGLPQRGSTPAERMQEQQHGGGPQHGSTPAERMQEPQHGGEPQHGSTPAERMQEQQHGGGPQHGSTPADRAQEQRGASAARPMEEARPQGRPTPQARPEARSTPQVRPEARPAPQARPETRPTPQVRPEARPAPQARPETRPTPQVRQEARPAPQARSEARPAPQARPEARPAPQARPQSAPHPESGHPAPAHDEGHPR